MCVWERVEERGCVVQISFISLQKNFRLRGGGGVAGEGVLRPQTQLYSYIVRFYSFKLDT